ncbi:MAG: hypothetical protein IPM51_03610 [Sphingobacteriaceae bacterium]|nr:hypothetical protein [Sphingobacteriaceae bacterium]
MKKIGLITLILISSILSAQDNLYTKIKERLKAEHPEINLENKLIAVNVWSAQDKTSRDMNAELNKAYSIYEFAKLKGGSRGMIGVLVSLNEDLSLNDITLTKDKTEKAISVVSNGLNVSGIKNVIFDSEGTVIQKNLEAGLFKQINQLVTR